MTIEQIQAFLELARCKSISDAAKRLYITQPALGRQLTAMEAELNMQLVFRSNRGVKLTPAGIALEKAFENVMDAYKKGVKEAKQISSGFAMALTIGVLEDLKIADWISSLLDFFEEKYPNIDIHIKRMSFGTLLNELYHGKLDAVISLDVNFLDNEGITCYNIKPYQPAFAVPLNHPLGVRDTLNYSDFKGVPMAIVDMDDCAGGVRHIERQFREHGGFYPNFYFTTSMKDVVFWVETGKKCAVVNMEMKIADSERVKMYPIETRESYYIQLAIKVGNENLALNLLKDYCER